MNRGPSWNPNPQITRRTQIDAHYSCLCVGDGNGNALILVVEVEIDANTIINTFGDVPVDVAQRVQIRRRDVRTLNIATLTSNLSQQDESAEGVEERMRMKDAVRARRRRTVGPCAFLVLQAGQPVGKTDCCFISGGPVVFAQALDESALAPCTSTVDAMEIVFLLCPSGRTPSYPFRW